VVHSKKLEETALWLAYQKKICSDTERSDWVQKVYKASANYLQDVRQTFQNYTLHDETHILNVLDAIGGLLGDQLGQLTVGEMELLILAASMHDLGMAYTDQERQRCFEDEEACRKFLRKYCPELLGYPAQDWSEDIRQWYLRTLHPFRLPDVLQHEAWIKLFGEYPRDVVSKRSIVAVCRAHGQNPVELYNSGDLKYQPADDVDPLFCALLLRIGDLLDFDDTRAPEVLYHYVACNEKSCEEWKKHQASAGFRYPESPSSGDLPYKARCTNPGVEHAIRDFLDWVDDELGNCIKLQAYCHADWQKQFPFPRAVLRKGIESDGYMSGDFCLTMDQAQVLKLLTGENLYDNMDVFVRELLQNAIDATLLRGEMDPDFKPEESRIDLWEWNDKDGNIWFRIDDSGTGMTLGMLQRYFLKVGNSYYNSRELERDLRDHGQTGGYHGISRFGIGFLSCFLCGNYAEVSTLYFDPDKNRREELAVDSYQTVHYGLCLKVTGLSGYYTLKNQAEHHQADGQLPAPDCYGKGGKSDLVRDGYRARPGTSVVVRLDPGKLGTLNLREATEKYLCGARVPVYYNNKRIGRTYGEIMQAAHEMAGRKIYELTPDMKRQFDQCFPAVCGQYPQIVVTVVPLDTQENQILPEFSGVLIGYHVRFEDMPQWKVKDQAYAVFGEIKIEDGDTRINLRSTNKRVSTSLVRSWKEWVERYGIKDTTAWEAEFEKCSVCPRKEDLPERIWQSLDDELDIYGEMDIHETWKTYLNDQNEKNVQFSIVECGCPDIVYFSHNKRNNKFSYVYQGVIAGGSEDYYTPLGDRGYAMFLAGGMWKPAVEISRSSITSLPLKAIVACVGMLSKYQMTDGFDSYWFELGEWKTSCLDEWREVLDSPCGQWILENQEDFITTIRHEIEEPLKLDGVRRFSLRPQHYDDYMILVKFFAAYFQESYDMAVDYEAGQTITFSEKKENRRGDILGLFPPMMFCQAANEQSRQYICIDTAFMRQGITMDHPFIVWLLENAVQLNKYYQRQFQQIIHCLCNDAAEFIIQECNGIREQFLALPERHGVDVSAFPKLGKEDFWYFS
jgi:hypothetical protein